METIDVPSKRTSWLRPRVLTLAALPTLLSLLVACHPTRQQDQLLSSRGYAGHQNNPDADTFVTAYPKLLGTRLDDCQTCHKGFIFSYDDAGGTERVFVNACDYCHLIQRPEQRTVFKEPLPTSYGETLNPYGLDYRKVGRTRHALSSIEGRDSDGDSFSNADELADLKYPGDPKSRPGQDVAPRRTFTLTDLQALPQHSELMLSNSQRQRYDSYATYAGVKVRDLLEAAGVDLNDGAITGVSIIAPDGYVTSFTLAEVTRRYPDGLYVAGLDNLGNAECDFVSYPGSLPAGLVDGAAIPDEQWLLLATSRDGAAMQDVSLDPSSGRIGGEGPLRLVVPQSVVGAPDRGSNYSPTSCGDGYDFDASKDHNAGAMVRGVVAVRVDPLPSGYEDFDYMNEGWALIYQRAVIVYGHGVHP
jgi:hypothetical protein